MGLVELVEKMLRPVGRARLASNKHLPSTRRFTASSWIASPLKTRASNLQAPHPVPALWLVASQRRPVVLLLRPFVEYI